VQTLAILWIQPLARSAKPGGPSNLASGAVTGRAALGERAGEGDARVGRGTRAEPFVKAPLCADCIGSYGSERVGDGLNVVSASSSRVYRGGSFDLPAAYARSTHRDAIGLAVRADYLGLRPARLPSA